MPVLDATLLSRSVEQIYVAAGVPADEAATVTRHQVTADLVGHHSHGVARTKRYLDMIGRGHIVPGANVEIVSRTGSTAVIDGHWGFGFVVMERAVDLALEMAAETGVAALTIRRQSHIGRLGAYGGRIAESGRIGMLMADSGLGPKHVTPFGGRVSRLGTNPLCIGFPGGPDGSVIVDMATSAVAGGKIEIALRQGRSIPAGWILDRNGRPSTDPKAYKDEGTLLPVGGDQGHKGYALSFAVEVFCGLLTGLGFGLDPKGRHNDGVFLSVWSVEHFQNADWFRSTLDDFIAYLKDTPLAEGFTEILYPGEIEHRTKSRYASTGVPIDEVSWAELQALGESLGVVLPTAVEVET